MVGKNSIPSVSWIRERDIDLLLASELHSESGFSEWFFMKCGFPATEFNSARISVTDAYGETDVFIEGKNEDSKVTILVEHKVGASFQFEQDLRYKKREQYITNEGDGIFANSVLIAPRKYILNSKNNFAKQISFEEIVSELRSYQDPRSHFFADALEVGIKYQKRGYKKMVHDDTSSFWMDYYELAIAEFSKLKMRRPDGKPSASNFCYFRDIITNNILGKKVVLVHKWPHGNADLQFSATHPEELYSLKSIEDGMLIVKANNSASVRINVPILDTRLPFNQQIDEVRAGLGAIERLYNFSRLLKC